MNQSDTSVQSFSDFSLSQPVQQAIEKSGYVVPSAIQAAVIPHLLDGRDVIGQAQTGTGKTAAFALPILSRLDPTKKAVQVLVLTPTRELAMQVAKSFSTYGCCLDGFSVAAIYGGQDYEPQLRHLRNGVNVIVGTPGRVIDHIKRGSLKIDTLDCLVLDEADEMLNMGFLEDVQFVLAQTPAETQIALFSATLPAPIRRIAGQYLKQPECIQIEQKTVTADNVRQRCLFAAPKEKPELLMRLLESEQTDGVIIFAKTKESTTTLADQLVRWGYAAAPLNGDMPQALRERTVEKLKSGQLNILVATDVAARGLDVPRISHVINFDVPHDSESYVHRIGRTGRAGRSGEAIILLSRGQRGRLRQIERMTRQAIEVVEAPTTEAINQKRIERFQARITDTIASRDVTFFKQLICQYTEQTGQPIELVAAALAEMTQNGRPLLLKDQPKAKRAPSGGFDRDRNGDRSARGEAYQSGPRRPGTGRNGPNRTGPVRDGMQRFRVEVGRVDGLKPGNLVGAIANEAGIDGQFIGPIDISHRYTTVDLPAGMPKDIVQTLRRTWVVGKQLNLRSVDDADGSNQYRQPYEGASNHPRSGKKSKAKVKGHTGSPVIKKAKKRKTKRATETVS